MIQMNDYETRPINRETVIIRMPSKNSLINCLLYASSDIFQKECIENDYVQKRIDRNQLVQVFMESLSDDNILTVSNALKINICFVTINYKEVVEYTNIYDKCVYILEMNGHFDLMGCKRNGIIKTLFDPLERIDMTGNTPKVCL